MRWQKRHPPASPTAPSVMLRMPPPPAFGEGGPKPQKRRRRPLLSQGRRDTMVVRQFVLRASALRPSALIRGAPVRRHPAKLSLERLGSAFAQLWDITSHFHASARLRPRSCPVSSPLEGPCGFGSRLGVSPALRGRGLTSGARFCSPAFSACPIRLTSGDIQLLDPRRSPL